MKHALILFAVNIFAITCVLTAGYMAVNHIAGWGWFLFAGIISVCTSVRIPDEDK
jgi:uncharacterized membrane protein HdeD (DUF308 family)